MLDFDIPRCSCHSVTENGSRSRIQSRRRFAPEEAGRCVFSRFRASGKFQDLPSASSPETKPRRRREFRARKLSLSRPPRRDELCKSEVRYLQQRSDISSSQQTSNLLVLLHGGRQRQAVRYPRNHRQEDHLVSGFSVDALLNNGTGEKRRIVLRSSSSRGYATSGASTSTGHSRETDRGYVAAEIAARPLSMYHVSDLEGTGVAASTVNVTTAGHQAIRTIALSRFSRWRSTSTCARGYALENDLSQRRARGGETREKNRRPPLGLFASPCTFLHFLRLN